MAEKLEFVRNYDDLSTERGFQFEFFCDRCGTTFRTEFQASAAGAVTELFGTASTIFSNIFGIARDEPERVCSSAWWQARDNAFRAAVTEVKPEFIQCTHCLRWVCRRNCWNIQKELCKECAPYPDIEITADLANHSLQEVWTHLAKAEGNKQDLAEGHMTTFTACPNCEASLPTNVKFCPECGIKIHTHLHCVECGASINLNARFCPDCGQKITK